LNYLYIANLESSSNDLQENINLKENIINDGDLNIPKMLNLQTILTKLDTILQKIRVMLLLSTKTT
jgi:hypothetical protein